MSILLLILFAASSEYDLRYSDYPQWNENWGVKSAYLRPYMVKPEVGSASDIAQFQNSAGSILSRIDATGRFGFGRTPSFGVDVLDAIRIGNTASPADGAIWYTGSDIVGQVSGEIKSLTQGSVISSTGYVTCVTPESISGRVAFWVNQAYLSGSPSFLWDNSTGRLGIKKFPGTEIDVLGGIAGTRIDGVTIDASSYFTLQQNRLKIYHDAGVTRLETPYDLRLAPTGGAKITAATLIEFDDFLGDKIRFYSHAYSVGVSAYNLDFKSDRDFRFSSDTVSDLFRIYETGNVVAKSDVYAGAAFRFSNMSVGDKAYWFGNLYKTYIAANTLGQQSDRYFYWGSDSNTDAMILDGDTGNLWLDGIITGNGSGLTDLVYTFAGIQGSASDKISLAAPLYWVDGNTIGIQADYYVKRSGDTMTGTLNMNNNIIYHPRIQLNPSSSATGLPVGEIRLYVPN